MAKRYPNTSYNALSGSESHAKGKEKVGSGRYFKASDDCFEAWLNLDSFGRLFKVAVALANKQIFLDIMCNHKMHKTNAKTLRVAQLRRSKVTKPVGYEG